MTKIYIGVDRLLSSASDFCSGKKKMSWFLQRVTDLKNTDLPNLRLQVLFYPSGDKENGKYKRCLQVDIDRHRTISANKLYNLAADYAIAGSSEIELRVFTADNRLGCVLNPLKIRDNVRIIFRRDDGYEDNFRVLIDEIPRRDLPNCLIDRRGFGRLLGRRALYDTLENSDEDPSSSTLIGSGQPSDEQTLLPQVPSSTTMASGRLSNEETLQPKIAKWRRPKSFLFKAHNRGSTAAAAAPAV